MARGRELTPQMRARICELHSINWTPTQIHKRYPELSISTIRSRIGRSAVRINQVSRPRTGAPRRLTEEQRDHIYDIVTHINPRVKMRELLEEVDNVVKLRCLRSLLREMNIMSLGVGMGTDVNKEKVTTVANPS